MDTSAHRHTFSQIHSEWTIHAPKPTVLNTSVKTLHSVTSEFYGIEFKVGLISIYFLNTSLRLKMIGFQIFCIYLEYSAIINLFIALY